MRSPRRLLAQVSYETELEIDAASRRMQIRLREAVERHMVHTPDGPRITATSYLAILKEVDHLLLELYPAAKAIEESPLMALIERRANEARRGPIDDAVEIFTLLLKNDPDLLAAIERDADDGE